MGERGALLGVVIACALSALAAGSGVARAETGFDVSVERFEITGDAPFVDEFDDGLRDAAPTVHFVDRGATEVSERSGALRLTDDDGAGDAPGFDLAVLDRPLRRGDAAAAITVGLRSDARAALRGLVLAPGDPAIAAAASRGLVLVTGRGPLVAVTLPVGPGTTSPLMQTQSMPWDSAVATPAASGSAPRPLDLRMGGAPLLPGPTRSFTLPAGAAICGAAGEEIVVLSDGVVTACAELPADSAGAAIELRIEALAASRLVRASYRLAGGASFIGASAWRVPAPVAGVALPPGAQFPGLLARAQARPGAHWVDYTGFATEDGITRGAGGAIVKLEGSLSRQRFPSQPEAPAAPAAGTFLLVSADDRDLRVSPGTAELETPRGRLRAVAEPVALSIACSASVGFSSLDSRMCSGSLAMIGTDLQSSDAEVVLQSWTGLAGAPPRADDPRPQPGTVGYSDGAVCTRVVGGTVVVLPGCRGPGDPGYDPATDGPDPMQTGVGFPAGAGDPATGTGVPGGSIGFDPALGYPAGPGLPPLVWPGGFHPLTGQAWRSDAAAASWNLQVLLVALSADSGAPNADPAEVFDPTRAYRTDGCSYLLPGACQGVRAFRRLAIEALPDDPDGSAAALRWLWRLGASYRIHEATGEFRALVGGHLHVAGPARSDVPGVAAIAGFFVTPPPVVDADADGVREPKDRCPARANPTQEDADGDRVGDACDVCTLDADPSQRDTDDDGIGNRCDADLDNDGRVGLRDLALLRVRMFTRDPNADMDGDGRVSLRDLALLKRRMFRPPGPAAPRLP